MIFFFKIAVVTDYAEGELFQILEDDGHLPEQQVSFDEVGMPSLKCLLFCLFYVS